MYSNRNVFEKALFVYDTALKGSGFHDNLYYAEHDDPTNENIKKGRENAILFDLNLLTLKRKSKNLEKFFKIL